MTHAELVELGRVYLSRRCSVVITELGSKGAKFYGYGETPDVIGWGFHGNSTLIECKASRTDYYRDRDKPYREEKPEDNLHLGMGERRFYLVPSGMVKPEECRIGWGLLWASDSGRVRCIKGAAMFRQNAVNEISLLVSAMCQRESVKATLRIYDGTNSQSTLTLSDATDDTVRIESAPTDAGKED